MTDTAAKPFFCFVHIEKAGGITLHNLLHRLFPTYLSPSPNLRFGEFFGRDELAKLTKLLPFAVQGIGGHRMGAFLEYEKVIDREVLYFTFMRHPIKRYMSHLNWQKQVMGIDWSIESFVETAHFNNYQAYRMAGERDLAAARYQIEHNFQMVGLMERYDESLLLLGRYLQLSYPELLYEKANIKHYQNQYVFEEQSAGLQQKIIENNRIDLALYDYVSGHLFDRQVDQYGPSRLISDLQSFQQINGSYGFPLRFWMKRKASNLLLKKFIQPYLLKR